MKNSEENWLSACTSFAENEMKNLYGISDSENRFPIEIHAAARRNGILDKDFPISLGGGGLSAVALVKGAEILATTCAPSAFTLGFNRGALHPVLTAGSIEQQERIVGSCIRDGLYASLCLTEGSNSGSNLMNIETTARPCDRGWVISGEKVMVGNGTVSDYFLTLARVEQAGRYQGLSFFAIPRSEATIVGPNTDKLGFRAVETPTVQFREAEVPDEQRIGEIGSGAALMMETLSAIRVGGAAVLCGLASGALKDALPWIEEREVYGGRLMHKSHVQLSLGALYGRLISVRQEVKLSATLKESGLPYATQASLAKLHASELAMDATDQIVQLFGWRGIDNQYPIQKRYRDARQSSIFEGTSEVQKTNLFHLLWKNWQENGHV